MNPCIPEALPIKSLDYAGLVKLVAEANRELGRFDGLLYGIPNPEVLLSPITTQEAVLSSRIEGTVASLSDVLQFESGELFPLGEDRKNDAVEIRNYRRALRFAQDALRSSPFNLNLMLELHRMLLDSVRGRDKMPGKIRTRQNWIGPEGASIEQATFVPPNPIDLPRLLTEWENYYHSEDRDPLIQLAVIHAYFEMLHPFNDGNGRIGRILIPLFLYEKKALSRPMFYLSGYLDARREEYIRYLRELERPGGWDQWIRFFLEAITAQARSNAQTARAVIELYAELKVRVNELARSKFAVAMLDHLFDRPITTPSSLTRLPGMPSLAMVSQLLKRWAEGGVLKVLREGQGGRPAVYALHSLINVCEGREVY